MTFKVATWNVNSLRVRLPHVQAWLADVKPDVLALQETKLPDPDFPFDLLLDAGYHAAASGQRTYNGVAILSRQPAKDIIKDLPGLEDPQRRVLGASFGEFRLLNIYVPNGESISSEKYQYKLNWLHKLDLFLKSELKKHPKMIVLGDFNIAPENIDVYDPKAWEGQVLFSEPERKAFQDMQGLGFKDCFRLRNQSEKSYSWWDYRLNAFKRNMGMRIDHILASTELAPHCLRCDIDKAPRKWERPSDHAPVIAEFSI